MESQQLPIYDVVIAGGGLVGATMACLLDKLDLSVALIDQTPFEPDTIPFQMESLTFDPRVSALTPASIQMLTDLGLWQHISAMRACGYQNMKVWDADGTGSIHFSADEIAQPSLGSIVENSILLHALYSKIRTLGTVTEISPFTIQSLEEIQLAGESLVTLSGKEGHALTARLVIAADGGNSRVRQLARISCKETDTQHQALVTTVRVEHSHRNTALQRFISTGPLAFLPLATSGSEESNYCSIVWSAFPERIAELMAMTDEDFRAELGAAMEYRLGEVQWSDKRHAFPLIQRHAESYYQDSIVLVGDAAHTIHPLAGQGVNLGLLDVQALTEELHRGIQAGRALSDPVILKRYQRRRRGHNLGMMWLMQGFKQLFAEEALPVRWLRNVGLEKIDNLAVVKNQLARRAMGIE